MLSDDDKKLADLIFELLKNATSQQVVKDFLKSKGVPVSAANWDELYEKRIVPALNGLFFSVSDLRHLLQNVEEYGRQHIFLFKCDPVHAKKLIAPARVNSTALAQNQLGLLTDPLDIKLPVDPTIVDVRVYHPDPTKMPVSLTVKVVETRISKTFQSESIDHVANTLTKQYSFTQKRAVSVATLSHEGLLELRIASQDNSTRYTDLVNSMLARVRHYIPFAGFNAVSLSNAKDKIHYDRVSLSSEFRYSNSTAKNDLGAVMQLSSSSQDDNLSSDSGSMGAIDVFLANKAHVTGTNIYAKIPSAASPREVHVLIGGEPNEFAIPVACTAGEYSYVREKIISLNT